MTNINGKGIAVLGLLCMICYPPVAYGHTITIDDDTIVTSNSTCKADACQSCFRGCMNAPPKNPSRCYSRCNTKYDCTGRCGKKSINDENGESASEAISMDVSSSSSESVDQCDTFQCDECVRWCMRMPPHNINQCFHTCGQQWGCKAHCGHQKDHQHQQQNEENDDSDDSTIMESSSTRMDDTIIDNMIAANKTCRRDPCQSCWRGCMKAYKNPSHCYKVCDQKYNCTGKCEEKKTDAHNDDDITMDESSPISIPSTVDHDNDDTFTANKTCNRSSCKSCWNACMHHTRNPNHCYKTCNQKFNCTGKCDPKTDFGDDFIHDLSSTSAIPTSTSTSPIEPIEPISASSLSSASSPVTIAAVDDDSSSVCDTVGCTKCVYECMSSSPYNLQRCYLSCNPQYFCTHDCH